MKYSKFTPDRPFTPKPREKKAAPPPAMPQVAQPKLGYSRQQDDGLALNDSSFGRLVQEAAAQLEATAGGQAGLHRSQHADEQAEN